MNDPSHNNPNGLYNPDFEHDSCGIGFVADINGKHSHGIVTDALLALANMTHRGAVGAEHNSGDGSGLLVGMPYDFFTRLAQEQFKIKLLRPGRFAVGNVFLPTAKHEREHCKSVFERMINEQGQRFLGWRYVPVDPGKSDIGPTARTSQPWIEQVFIIANDAISQDEFDRQLFVIRKRAGLAIRNEKKIPNPYSFYVCSLSSRLIIYKGMLTPIQLKHFFPDLSQYDFQSHLAVVHARFSTNTAPSWDRAQPNRFMCHNGEINTLRSNVNYMTSRQGVMKSPLFSNDDLRNLFPIIEPNCSDSGSFDNAIEMLLMSGRSLPESMMMMIPEAWRNDPSMDDSVKSFYEYHSCLQEPWDGPASIVFTDGNILGAVLDRNGLRPSRYYITHDNRVIMASEAGVIPIAPENIKFKGRLQPGKIFVIDFGQGRLIPDEELKQDLASQRPYAKWLKKNVKKLNELQPSTPPARVPQDELQDKMRAFGYTVETLHFMLVPLVEQERDPVGSMGNDAALACLSEQPHLIYDYFRQMFAQVTNPAIDSIREEVIMSLECFVGPEQSLLETTSEHCNQLLIRHPILTNERFAALRDLDQGGWRTKIIDTTYYLPQKNSPKETTASNKGTILCDGSGMQEALDRICTEAEQAIDEGYSLVALSDRNVDHNRIGLSPLMACATVHHHLIQREKRTRIGLIVETGEAREVHHHCLLVGYGADAINPYLAYEALWHCRSEGMFKERFSNPEDIVEAYRKGVAKGMLKVMAKMGISTLHSYKGSQIFEILGINSKVVSRCFPNTPSRIEGIGFDVLETEILRRHEWGYPPRPGTWPSGLLNTAQFHWRSNGEHRTWNPRTISTLQIAARQNSWKDYEQFATTINDEAHKQCTLRGLLSFKKQANGPEIPLEDVEPASEIVKRFCTGAMSYGSLSAEAHESLAIALNRFGGRSNTGEGGENPDRFIPLPNGDSRSSAIKQVASGRFGVTAWYLANAKELQIKISQGAKPGEGGEIPGHKVDQLIARTRHSTPGVGLISPPPHHDIYSIEDLKQLIHDLKNSNPEALISVKLVSEAGVGTIAAGVAKGFADAILISGDVGGTGASPLTSIKHAGLPWELGLAETHQTLVLNNLRSRVVLQTDGGLKTGRDVVIACCLGAEEFGFSTAPLITLGCVMMRKCHLNTCPVGITTQDPTLRQRFAGKPEHLINYLFMVAKETRNIMASLGFRTINEMIGRVDALMINDAARNWKSDSIDLTAMLTSAQTLNPNANTYCTKSQNHSLDKAIDNELIKLANPAITDANPVVIEYPICNTNRVVGTMLSHTIVRRWGENGLPDNTISIKFRGSAGQSFGAFLCSGITMLLQGDANDYVGKGLSGGIIAISSPANCSFVPKDNIIIGSVALYGATRGQMFVNGIAAERFCVRNSGAWAVVEGVGDHCCEYMTGGRCVVLGPTGRNFGAGMSGGIAYVWDPERVFADLCNMATIELEQLEDPQEIFEVNSLIDSHFKLTGSTVAADILARWNSVVECFVKVMPLDYKRVLQERSLHDEELDTRIHGVATDG